VIDTLKESHQTDENNATEMQKVVSSLVACTQPAALVIVAHGKKTNADNPQSLVNGNRGSNYVVGAVDGIMHLSSKGLEVGGRAIEETFIPLDRRSDGAWELNEKEKIKHLAQRLLAGKSGESLRELARQLAGMTGKDETACLSILARLNKGQFT
jgi:hypothetical protein